MNITFKQVFRFDWNTHKVHEIILQTQKNDFNDYCDELVFDVINDQRSRKYLFPANITETKALMGNVLGAMDDQAGYNSAKRLLNAELDVQDRIEHLNREVQRGILLIAVVKNNDRTFFLLIKAEHVDFINEENRQKATGLPIKKKIFKSFCAYLDENNTPEFAYVSDSKASISTYWWKTFLQLEEEYTDEANTAAAFDAIDRRIFTAAFVKKYPRDTTILRNSTILYFRAQREFILSEYIESIIRPYIPQDNTLNMDALASRIEALPEQVGFNSRFTIVPGIVTARIRKVVFLTPQLDLVIKDALDLENNIIAVKEKGVKYLKIRTDDGYDKFLPKQKTT